MKNNDIINTIDILRCDNFYGGGNNIEIAKGKNQMVDTWRDAKSKIKRLIKAKK